MREVKFRAYTKEYGMQNVRELLWKDDGSIASVSFDSGISVLTNRGVGKDIVVEQYTGINDYLDNEIYEGDIVLARQMVPGDPDSMIGVVNFFEGAYWIDNKHDGIKLWNETVAVNVIGNVHEDYELVEGDE